jgi:hypothetical protein
LAGKGDLGADIARLGHGALLERVVGATG